MRLVESLLSAVIGNPEIQSDHSIALGQYATLADAQARQRIVQQLGLEAMLRSEQKHGRGGGLMPASAIRPV